MFCREGVCDTVNSVATSEGLTCALSASGRMLCWGSERAYFWGFSPEWGATKSPTLVQSIRNVVAFARDAELNHCALLDGGELRCWNRYGVAPGIASGVRQVSIHSGTMCAVMDDGTLRCWGNGAGGRLAPIPISPVRTPTPVPGLTDIVQVSVSGRFVCVRRSTGRLACWGENFSGQVGAGSVSGIVLSPLEVVGITDAVDVDTGSMFACAAHSGGRVSCWGAFSGNGTWIQWSAPVGIMMPERVVDLAIGERHTCARVDDGSVRCWATLDSDGQLGGGSPGPGWPPVNPGLTDVVSIDASRVHSCAALGSGDVRCWGLNDVGQIGDGTVLTAYAPTPPAW